MRAWVTKYALTAGVQLVEGDSSDGMLTYRTGKGRFMQFAHKGEWFDSEAGALARADEMRHRKIASLKKQIGRLDSLTFTVKSV
jgi:hypothetical protein